MPNVNLKIDKNPDSISSLTDKVMIIKDIAMDLLYSSSKSFHRSRTE